MSDTGGKKIKVWGGIVEYGEPTPNARAEAIKAAIDANSSAFEQHKEKLLAVLRDVHKRGGPRSEPFDPDKTWRQLTSIAQLYFWRGRLRQDTMPAADRTKRLRELAKALGRARRLADKAMQDEVKAALFSAWHHPNVRYDVVPDGPLALVRVEDEFDKVVAGLSALEAVARRAADDVGTKAGRPKGTGALQKDDIEGIAAVYRDSTGSMPGSGDGPFAKFVIEVLTAMGRHLAYESVIDAIKDAGLRAVMTTNWEGSSWCDENA